MATFLEAVRLLDRAVERLAVRRSDVDSFERAYRGEHALTYASQDFREFFGERYSKFSDNWCQVVADAPHERLCPTGVRLPEQTEGDKGLWETWKRTESDYFSDLAMLDAIVAKRAYAIVWADEDDEPTISWEHPSQCIVIYEPGTRNRVAGVKVWDNEDGREYATLYLADEVWKFERANMAPTARQLEDRHDFVLPRDSLVPGGWGLRSGSSPNPMPNPMGKVPMVEVANRPKLMGEPISDLACVLPMQHAVNLFWSYLFSAADEATMGQRVVTGAETPTIPILDDEGRQVGERPVDLKNFTRKSILWLEDPNAKTSQWETAKLDVFTEVIEIMVGHVAAQTRTPAHYLLIGGTVANVSGDAMKALETGLVKRTVEKTQHFGRALRDVFELVALADDDAGKARAIRRGEVLWADVENRSDAQRADSLAKKRDMGYPLKYLLELDGLPPHEIERVMAMVREEGADPIMERLLRPARQLPDAPVNGVPENDGDAA